MASVATERGDSPLIVRASAAARSKSARASAVKTPVRSNDSTLKFCVIAPPPLNSTFTVNPPSSPLNSVSVFADFTTSFINSHARAGSSATSWVATATSARTRSGDESSMRRASAAASSSASAARPGCAFERSRAASVNAQAR